MKWNPDELKWIIVHYTHSIDDMDQKMKEYPDPQFVHLIDLKWIKSHDIMQQVQAFRERMKNE